ncbi:hypothetical protein F5146DRAFT_1143915 [Armillaria mellea]|nr:hypothetical protein F5146DRAFT_1143915 [Armillaria mellea]
MDFYYPLQMPRHLGAWSTNVETVICENVLCWFPLFKNARNLIITATMKRKDDNADPIPGLSQMPGVHQVNNITSLTFDINVDTHDIRWLGEHFRFPTLLHLKISYHKNGTYGHARDAAEMVYMRYPFCASFIDNLLLSSPSLSSLTLDGIPMRITQVLAILAPLTSLTRLVMHEPLPCHNGIPIDPLFAPYYPISNRLIRALTNDASLLPCLRSLELVWRHRVNEDALLEMLERRHQMNLEEVSLGTRYPEPEITEETRASLEKFQEIGLRVKVLTIESDTNDFVIRVRSFKMNAEAPINKLLSDDVFTLIFAGVAAEETKHSALYTILQISFVCRRWRSVALSFPELWSNVCLKAPKWHLVRDHRRRSLASKGVIDSPSRWMANTSWTAPAVRWVLGCIDLIHTKIRRWRSLNLSSADMCPKYVHHLIGKTPSFDSLEVLTVGYALLEHFYKLGIAEPEMPLLRTFCTRLNEGNAWALNSPKMSKLLGAWSRNIDTIICENALCWFPLFRKARNLIVTTTLKRQENRFDPMSGLSQMPGVHHIHNITSLTFDINVDTHNIRWFGGAFPVS